MTIAERPSGFQFGPKLSDSEFGKIAELIKNKAGITITDGSHTLVVSRLSRHLKRLNLNDFQSYIALLQRPDSESEIGLLVDALTTNTTKFFREPHHFELLESDYLPRLAQRARDGKRVRLWSAACSSGEEPYCIAATVLKAFPDAAKYDVKILATDINTSVLQRAEEGVYESRLADGLTDDQMRRMFTSTGSSSLSIRDELRELVTFRYLNFVEPWPVNGPFDVIFCRNAAIYMDTDVQNMLWSKMESVLDLQGALLIGHSERIGSHLANRLELFAPTSFRRPETLRNEKDTT